MISLLNDLITSNMFPGCQFQISLAAEVPLLETAQNVNSYGSWAHSTCKRAVENTRVLNFCSMQLKKKLAFNTVIDVPKLS